MRILHVTPYFVPAYCYGGPPRSIWSLCCGLSNFGVDVEVLTTTANGQMELTEEITQSKSFEGIPVCYLPRRFPKRHFFASSLSKELNSRVHQFDFVHIHTCWNYMSSTTMRVCRGLGKPYVVSPRGMLDTAGLKRSRLKKRIAIRLGERNRMNAATAFHASTDKERRNIQRFGISKPVEVVPNSFDITEFQHLPQYNEFRCEHGIGSDEIVVLSVGRLHPQKGIDRLAEAVRHLNLSNTPCRLVLAGEGSSTYVNSLRTEFADLLAQNALIFAGNCVGSERLAAYAAADIFASASESESFGMSIAEAMAAGLPVVVSRECPWPQIDDWNCGFRVERSPKSIGKALTTLIHNKDLRKSMGANGRHGIAGEFDLRTVASRMIDFYSTHVLSGEVDRTLLLEERKAA